MLRLPKFIVITFAMITVYRQAVYWYLASQQRNSRTVSDIDFKFYILVSSRIHFRNGLRIPILSTYFGRISLHHSLDLVFPLHLTFVYRQDHPPLRIILPSTSVRPSMNIYNTNIGLGIERNQWAAIRAFVGKKIILRLAGILLQDDKAEAVCVREATLLVGRRLGVSLVHWAGRNEMSLAAIA